MREKERGIGGEGEKVEGRGRKSEGKRGGGAAQDVEEYKQLKTYLSK